MADSPVAIAILGKMPLPGSVKTRLIAVLGNEGAARFQERLVRRTVATALAADIGPVTLWCAPDINHPLARELAAALPISIAAQPAGDLGKRMLRAASEKRPTLILGTDCPALTAEHLRACAQDLRNGSDITLIPAEDGGYVLIGMSQPQPKVFENIVWGTAHVLAITRARIAEGGLSCTEHAPLWDIDRPADLERLSISGLMRG